MFNRIAGNIQQNIEMSFSIPDSERQRALLAAERFELFVSKLAQAVEHLDVIYSPFKSSEEASPESIIQGRGEINRYTQKIKENFDGVINTVRSALKEFNYFSIDAQVNSLITSTVDDVGTLETEVNNLLGILGNVRSESFKDDLLKSIENIQTIADQIKTLVNDRVISFIYDHIIGKTWMVDKSDTADGGGTNRAMETIKPLMQKLIEERRNAINGTPQSQDTQNAGPQSQKENIALNPSDANKVWDAGGTIRGGDTDIGADAKI